MIVIMSFYRSAAAKLQSKELAIEDIRNGAHRHERETRCGKSRHQRFFTTEVTCPRWRLIRTKEVVVVKSEVNERVAQYATVENLEIGKQAAVRRAIVHSARELFIKWPLPGRRSTNLNLDQQLHRASGDF